MRLGFCLHVLHWCNCIWGFSLLKGGLYFASRSFLRDLQRGTLQTRLLSVFIWIRSSAFRAVLYRDKKRWLFCFKLLMFEYTILMVLHGRIKALWGILKKTFNRFTTTSMHLKYRTFLKLVLPAVKTMPQAYLFYSINVLLLNKFIVRFQQSFVTESYCICFINRAGFLHQSFFALTLRCKCRFRNCWQGLKSWKPASVLTRRQHWDGALTSCLIKPNCVCISSVYKTRFHWNST